MRILPPLNPLRVFEVAARHESFTRAADELGVTQAAVSRQVGVLEGAIAVRLFERRRNGIRLTERGRQYLEACNRAFDLIENSTKQIRGSSTSGRLRVRSYTTLSAHWLIPRLPDFSRRHPDIEISLSTSVVPADFRREDIDISVQFGDGKWPGVSAYLLLSDLLAPVCSPEYLASSAPLKEPRDVLRHPLLHSRYRRRDWPDWLAFVGLDPVAGGSAFDSSTLTYQAARQGVGVAMGQIELLTSDLREGTLVTPLSQVLQRPLGYYVVQPANTVQDPKIRIFREWLLEQAR
jgi:LysR family glycine cleavage system transcriptional activator